MTREQFLKDLRAALAGMKEDELQGVLSYYEEMIDDRMEAGMTEEAAVKAMEPVKEIAARVLEEAGVTEEKPRSREKGDWQEIRRAAADVRVLHIQAEGKRVTVSAEEESDQVVLRYCIGSGDIFRLHEDEGVLTLEHKLRPVSSFINEKSEEGFSLDSILSGVGKLLSSLGDRVIGAGGIFSYEAPENEIEVCLPADFAGKLRIGTSNARISVDGVTCEQSMVLSTSNSRISASDVTCAQDVAFTTSNSRIVLEDVHVNGARLMTTNSRIVLEDVHAAADIVANTSNSGITVEDTQAGGLLQLTTSNGKVELDGACAHDIDIKTSNASVCGTVKGRMEEYTVRSSTSNAANQLGSREGGDKTLHVVTSNGAISLGFDEE